MKDDLINIVNNRLEELEEDYGDSEYDQIRIKEILRDEFNEEKYNNALIELGINEEEIGLEENSLEETTYNDPNTAETKDALLKIMMIAKDHIFKTRLRLEGKEIRKDKVVKVRAKFLIPSSEIDFIEQSLEALYSPQNLISKLHTNTTYFDDTMNTLINNFRVRLENYHDKIVSAKEMRIAIDIFLNEINVIRNAIISGRLGDITRDMIINSYNEKQETNPEDKLDKLKKELGV